MLPRKEWWISGGLGSDWDWRWGHVYSFFIETFDK